MTKLITSIIT